ncbi:hypothetical protein [Myceligenerans halotolerans]
MLTYDVYPTDHALDSLQTFRGSPKEFLDRVHGLWNFTYGTLKQTPAEDWQRPVVSVELVTGGWSGNEAVIAAITDTMFQILFWQASARGGWHEYRIPDEIWTSTLDFGLPRRPD